MGAKEAWKADQKCKARLMSQINSKRELLESTSKETKSQELCSKTKAN